jgi:hypothetical protein
VKGYVYITGDGADPGQDAFWGTLYSDGRQVWERVCLISGAQSRRETGSL